MRNLAHIHQTNELAERVLIPGDPGRALRLAQELLDSPKMLNHNRGLWGYTGTAADGELLSVQSTGMGGPSVAIVATELIELGARRLIRVGSCRGLNPSLELGQPLVVSAALAGDGTSRALGGHRWLEPVKGSPSLFEALDQGGPHATLVASLDLFYEPEAAGPDWEDSGAEVVDLETATLFTVAARHGAEAGCALFVSDKLAAPGRLEPGAMHAAEIELGRLAIAALR